MAELGEDSFGQLAWPDENIPRPQRSPQSLLKKKSSRPLSSTLSNVWSSFRGLSSIDSTEKDQDTEDELFFKDLYASSWMQRIFTRTRRLSQKMSKLRAIKHDMSKQALIDRLCMGYMDLENKRVRVLIQGPFLQIYEAGQDFRSRFPLYVMVFERVVSLTLTRISLMGPNHSNTTPLKHPLKYPSTNTDSAPRTTTQRNLPHNTYSTDLS